MRPVALLTLIVATGCSDTALNYKTDPPSEVINGAIRGRVCDPSGRTWLPDAMAYVNLMDDEGRIYDTEIAYSDLDGRWELGDLPGEKTYGVYVQYGPEILLAEEVYIGSGETVQLDEPECFDPLALDVAVVMGDYDDFHLVLNEMGFANYELIDGTDQTTVMDFLGNPEEMARFDIIFFNGGFVEDGVIYDTVDSSNTIPSTNVANVVAYVEAGGSIYASDWAYDLVEIGWPDRADFVGADEVPNDAQLGDYVDTSAAVSDTSLSEFLDAQYVDITYDLPVWPPVETVSSSVSVHLTGDVAYSDGLSEHSLTAVPLLYSFNAGYGKVAFSTFRVARNADQQMVDTLQYMMYNL